MQETEQESTTASVEAILNNTDKDIKFTVPPGSVVLVVPLLPEFVATNGTDRKTGLPKNFHLVNPARFQEVPVHKSGGGQFEATVNLMVYKRNPMLPEESKVKSVVPAKPVTTFEL